MASRLELQTKLEELLGSKNVYYQPPESIKMSYPAIRYSFEGYKTIRADNGIYIKVPRYDVTLISKKPDPEYVDKLIEMRGSRFGRHYESNNLHHYTFTINNL